jgi:nucleoside-triphosphatase THEP1
MPCAEPSGRQLPRSEIGPLQLEHPGFRDCIDAVVKDPRVSVIASLAQPERCEVPATRRYVESLMRHPRSTVLHLKQGENGIRARIEPEFRERLAQELATALLLMRQMPRQLWGEAG